VGTLARAVRLDARERRAVLRAAGWLGLWSVAVRILPYRLLPRGIARLRVRGRGPRLDAAQCSRAVQRASRLIPGATCLPQALAAACLLRRDGVASILNIGVRLDRGRGFHAHAWLESCGLVVAGAGEAVGHAVVLRDEFQGSVASRHQLHSRSCSSSDLS